jgi:hypothetical protein
MGKFATLPQHYGNLRSFPVFEPRWDLEERSFELKPIT